MKLRAPWLVCSELGGCLFPCPSANYYTRRAARDRKREEDRQAKLDFPNKKPHHVVVKCEVV